MSQAFFLPTRVLSGQGCVVEHSNLLARLGKKAAVITGKSSAKLSGAEADVITALKKENIPYFIFDRVNPNPGIPEVREAAALVRKERADFVIGIGGGSPLDAAKAVAVLACNDLDDETLLRSEFSTAPLPLAAIPTTAGTGSEVTQYSILTNHKLQTKSNLSHESLFPKLAFLDPQYLKGLPMTVTINTAVDALSHAVEGYLAVRATVISDQFALSSLRLLGEALPLLDRANEAGSIPSDLREKLMRASTLSGMVIAHSGTTAGHAMGYPLTYFRDIDHGRANALTMAEYLAFLAVEKQDRVERVLEALGFRKLEPFQALLNRLLGPREILTNEEIEKFSGIALAARNIGNTLRKPTQEDLIGIYRRSFS